MSLKRVLSAAVLILVSVFTTMQAEANPGWPIYHSNGQKVWNGSPGWPCYYLNGQIQTSNCNGTRVYLGSSIYLTVTTEEAYLEVGGTIHNLLNRSSPTQTPKPFPPSDGSIFPPSDGSIFPPADGSIFPPADGSTTLFNFNFFSKNFLFKNNCRYPVRLAIHYRKTNGEWTTEGWWNIAPFQETYLASKGTRLTTNSSIWYYYAETTDGSGEYWKGDYPISFGTFFGTSFERKLPMRKMQDNDNNWSISCW